MICVQDTQLNEDGCALQCDAIVKHDSVQFSSNIFNVYFYKEHAFRNPQCISTSETLVTSYDCHKFRTVPYFVMANTAFKSFVWRKVGMKITLNMVRQRGLLNVSPSEVGNSWTSRVTVGFQRQTLLHAVHFVNWTLFILYVHGISTACMLLQVSKQLPYALSVACTQTSIM
jgi:hypothetical protein